MIEKWIILLLGVGIGFIAGTFVGFICGGREPQKQAYLTGFDDGMQKAHDFCESKGHSEEETINDKEAI